jgi:hypothetical protein
LRFLLLEIKAVELKVAVMSRMGGILLRYDSFIRSDDAKDKNEYD